jgi:hypothetical protein
MLQLGRLPPFLSFFEDALNRAGLHLLALDPHHRQYPFGDIDSDQVSILHQSDGAALSRLRGDVPDAGSPGGAGKPSIRHDRRAMQIGVGHQGLGGGQDLGHPASPGAFVADDHHGTGLDFSPDDGLVGGLLPVEDPRRPFMGAHFRGHRGVFDHRPFGGDVSLQDRDGAVGFTVFHPADHVPPLKFKIGQVPFSPAEEAFLLYPAEVFSKGLSGCG